MRKTFGVALATALVGGLALAALGAGAADRTGTTSLSGDASTRAAQRAAATYNGSFKNVGPDSTIRIKARIKDGEAKTVNRMRYSVRMDCKTSGATQSSAGWTFTGLKVQANRRFAVAGVSEEAPESTLAFKGRFSKNFKRVRGTFRTHQWFDEETKPKPLPAEYCNLAKTRYGAARG